MATFTNEQVKQVSLGNGDFRIGTPLEHVGPIKGNFSLDIARTIAMFKAGVPQILYKQLATDEEVFVKMTLASFNLGRVQNVLGIGTFSSVSGGSTPVTATGLTFNDVDATSTLIGLQLGFVDIAASPAPVVRPLGGGVPYTVTTDYIIDIVFGQIRRVSGSTIPATGSVQVEFTYTAVAAEAYFFGGLSAVTYQPAQFIHTRSDSKRIIADIWRASTNGRLLLEFREVEWNLYDVQFNAIADLGRPEGQLYFKITRET